MQVNGGSMEEKVDFGYSLFEQSVSVDSVFQPNEMLDTIAITKGKGTEGVVTRWGVTRLPRKTHRGLRKVISVNTGAYVAEIVNKLHAAEITGCCWVLVKFTCMLGHENVTVQQVVVDLQHD